VRIQNWHVFVAPAFRRALWNQADARLKAGATHTKTAFSHRLFSLWNLRGRLLKKNPQAQEPVWQPRFPQPAFSVEAHILSRFNKSENAKGMGKSIFASFHTGSEA
jgi:hypothetical protein